ncbi:hypothetical protein ACJBU6_01338 [Exserohilum turcicum]
MDADEEPMSRYTNHPNNTNSDTLQNDYHHHLDGPYFYRVTSEYSATLFHIPAQSAARGQKKCLFQTTCAFDYSHLSGECIQEHLRLRDSGPSPFISVFDDFAEALRVAYTFYLRGHEAIQIVQIDASNLMASLEVGIGNSHDAVIPVWQGNLGGSLQEDIWLRVMDIGPLFALDPKLMRSSEWLACGSIVAPRYSASWPVLAGELFFEETYGEELVHLLEDHCGCAPEYFREETDMAAKYAYDWTERRFLEITPRDRPGVSYGGIPTAGVGLNPVSSIFARPTLFGYAGYLRGMIVMD